MAALKKHPVIALVLVIFVLVALTQEPSRSASAVGEAWDGLSSGTGNFMDGFFTFVEDL